MFRSQVDEHSKLFCGPMEEIIGDYDYLGTEFADLIITSPPYSLGKDYGPTYNDTSSYHEYLENMFEWLQCMYRALKSGGRLCINLPFDTNLQFVNGVKRSVKTPLLYDIMGLLTDDVEFQRLVYNTSIIWLENNVSRRTAWGSFMKATDPWINLSAEAIVVFSKDARKRDGTGRISDISREEFIAYTLGIWEFSGEHAKNVGGHTAAFPEELPYRLIKLFSFQGDVVFDPFAGSHTTGAVALRLGRDYVGIDINEDFHDFGVRRLQKVKEELELVRG